MTLSLDSRREICEQSLESVAQHRSIHHAADGCRRPPKKGPANRVSCWPRLKTQLISWDMLGSSWTNMDHQSNACWDRKKMKEINIETSNHWRHVFRPLIAMKKTIHKLGEFDTFVGLLSKNVRHIAVRES